MSQPPNVLVNEVSYKTLGFLPGSVRQEGEITPINSDTFEVRGRRGGWGGGSAQGQLGRTQVRTRNGSRGGPHTHVCVAQGVPSSALSSTPHCGPPWLAVTCSWCSTRAASASSRLCTWTTVCGEAAAPQL